MTLSNLIVVEAAIAVREWARKRQFKLGRNITEEEVLAHIRSKYILSPQAMAFVLESAMVGKDKRSFRNDNTC